MINALNPLLENADKEEDTKGCVGDEELELGRLFFAI